MTTRRKKPVDPAVEAIGLDIHPDVVKEISRDARKRGMEISEYLCAAVLHSTSCDYFPHFLNGWCEVGG